MLHVFSGVWALPARYRADHAGQRHAFHADRPARRNLRISRPPSFAIVTSGLLHRFSLRRAFLPDPDPAGRACAGLRGSRGGQFHVGGADRLSAAGGSHCLDAAAGADRFLHVGHLRRLPRAGSTTPPPTRKPRGGGFGAVGAPPLHDSPRRHSASSARRGLLTTVDAGTSVLFIGASNSRLHFIRADSAFRDPGSDGRRWRARCPCVRCSVARRWGLRGIFLLGSIYCDAIGHGRGFSGSQIGMTASQIALFVAMLFAGALLLQYPIGWLLGPDGPAQADLSARPLWEWFRCTIGWFTGGGLWR